MCAELSSQQLRSNLLRTVELRIEGLPPNPNQTVRHHWSKNYQINQQWKNTAAWAAKARFKGQPFQRAHLAYTISVGDNRKHDADNLIASCKRIQDGLVGIIIKDDDMDSITVSYSFNREKPRGVSIKITELAESAPVTPHEP